MPKAHRSWPQQGHSQLSSQHHPEIEMSFQPKFQPHFGTPGGQTRSPPNRQGGEKDQAHLSKNFTSMTLNPQATGENKSQQGTKGPETTLCNQYEMKVRPCIDLIDSLRALGVEQDLALPAIAVIGDQSSGKSSVLEALSGIALPRGSGIVTRCPLVLKMKKQFSRETSWKGKISYQNVELQLQQPSQVEREIVRAQNIVAGSGVGISHELISLEISSTDVPDLTLIDLPGITRLPVGDQPPDIGQQVKALIKKYIQRQETINLVVIPCNVDIATTEALSMAQEVDPEGDRTIGILTKPDLVDKGAEKNVLNVVQNLTYSLKKGYMIVKCRGQQDITENLSLAEATKREMTFFQSHTYFRTLLQEGKATVSRLAERLTTELISHITKSLPLLENQIRVCLQSATEELQHCGESIPTNESDMMFFLIEKIKLFNQDIERLVEGEEVVKEEGTRLFNKLREEFKNWAHILDISTQNVSKIIREQVSIYEKQYRGKELHGFTSYKTFEMIVQQYIEQLVDPAVSMLRTVVEIVRQTFSDTVKYHFGEFFNLNQTAQSKVEDIKMKQLEEAENIIRLQFKMEKLVFCQDQIYSVVLQQKRAQAFNPLGNASQTQDPATFALTEISMHLNTYFSETRNRLANQIPFIIQYFILQENGNCLQKTMLQILQEKERYSWLLQEQNDTAHKRRVLKEKIYRLTQARRALCKLSY
ncbi:interferon-induced GTP-binding protein Mx2 [Pteronotus mesoamericanus]|uniref:interferon-induced GTP-binding protein Mx2 n=1 Tax=Pteronotus mesoamericanus TaxID=1884717 RepID=UPI0023EA929E|nr:interferon-induced GTP-binding protein Mx2 [Pteronotus parnellii mesoamericanus]XP_054434512.1 interferon-induced GTP-binding protein Mx2 [Pteronotus parnellii mesoamericanus]XP_054434520.1 interferon-induced GTP-binding protein Mx2 [Pteronotus parnellii mesoamericanus]